MKEFEDGLVIRFDIVSKTATDREFYQSLYHYFEYINKTPLLKDILDKSEEQYDLAFNKIWRGKRRYSDEESEKKCAEVSKLERFNLYALGSLIDVRIYFPINQYRNRLEADENQNPIAIILMRGLDYALSLKRWDKENLQRHNRWFEGKRTQYEVVLRRFHLMFLEELIKVKEPLIKDDTPVNFYLDVASGSFKYYKIEGNLSPKSREFRFLKILYVGSGHQATYKELSGNPDVVSRNDKITLTETIKTVKRKLGILPKKKGSNPDIIKNISKYGYKLDI